jgi:hypothetical protein
MTEGFDTGNAISRRTMLGAGIVAGGTVAGIATPAVSASAAPMSRRWTGRVTQNGWPVVGSGGVVHLPVEGSGATVALRAGDVATVLLHAARRLHYELAALGPGSVQGHTTDRTVRAPFESNHLSGTAVALYAGSYPAGSAGNLFGRELLVLRDVLADCEGVVRWGGDDRSVPKEGHLQIDVPPSAASLARVAAKLRRWRESELGAGTPVDLASPSRRKAAATLARTQTA